MAGLKKYFSKKLIKIISYNTFIDAEKQSSDSTDMLIIHTANGLYQGNLKQSENFANFELLKDDDILTAIRKIYLSFLDEHSKNSDDSIEDIIENPITIDLEDVTLISNTGKISLPFVSIFVDQIIGISIGRAENT